MLETLLGHLVSCVSTPSKRLAPAFGGPKAFGAPGAKGPIVAGATVDRHGGGARAAPEGLRRKASVSLFGVVLEAGVVHFGCGFRCEMSSAIALQVQSSTRNTTTSLQCLVNITSTAAVRLETSEAALTI